VTPTTTSKQ